MAISAIRIKAARQRLGESQAAFGRRLGVSQACICRWEQGRLPHKFQLNLRAIEMIIAATTPSDKASKPAT